MMLALLEIESIAMLLKEFDVASDELRLSIEDQMVRLPNRIETERLPISPRAKEALKLAKEEAQNFGVNDFRPEYLLLGLIRLPVSPLVPMFHSFQISAQAVREKIKPKP